jgi:hypothetical protein
MLAAIGRIPLGWLAAAMTARVNIWLRGKGRARAQIGENGEVRL